MITNNDVMKKLRVALQLRDTDIIAILRLAEFDISETELSAIFRREDHPHYRECGDQLLRRFLDGLIIKNRGKMERPAARPVASRPVAPRLDARSSRIRVEGASPVARR